MLSAWKGSGPKNQTPVPPKFSIISIGNKTMALADVSTAQQLLEQQYDRTVREDIELFRTQAHAYKSGQLTDDQFRPHRLRRGIYGQRQEGVHMIRTKVPGGLLTSGQMR